MNRRSALAKIFTIVVCLLLTGYDLSSTFWEQEGVKVAEDIVDGEENLTPKEAETLQNLEQII